MAHLAGLGTEAPGVGRRLMPFRGHRSLQVQVALSFALAVAMTALALSLAAYYLTKHSQEQSALSGAIEQSRLNLTIADQMLPQSPDSADYEALMSAFGIRGDFDALIQTASETYRSGLAVNPSAITADLEAAVSGGNVRYQRVLLGAEPAIVVGSLLRSGAMRVYFFFPQGAALADLADLRRVLVGADLVLAVLGAVGGSLLARRLLRPVRGASRAAIQMSRGDLAVRLPAGSDEFGRLAESFNQMAASLQARLLDLEGGQARERRFVADVTHELRTPVSALVGEASLLEARLQTDTADASSEVHRLAQMVSHDIARLRQLIDDLLEICRLDAKQAESVVEPIEIGPFVTSLVQAHGWSQSVSVFRSTDGERGEATAADAGAIRALADKRLLERILGNLIENSLVHGSAPVNVEIRDSISAVIEARGFVSIAVADSGRGIPLHALTHVFDRFYKGDPSRSASRGSGLGLAIARESARLLAGDITAANLPDGGARFVLTLPPAEP